MLEVQLTDLHKISQHLAQKYRLKSQEFVVTVVVCLFCGGVTLCFAFFPITIPMQPSLWGFLCISDPMGDFSPEWDFFLCWHCQPDWYFFPGDCYCVRCMSELKEQISRFGCSFWMNDLPSWLPGSLHQTWPTLVINDSGGQCPISVAESSIMPGQRKPPEFHHSKVLLPLK